jgi:aldehyde:ferredoxin oxidoreductase
MAELYGWVGKILIVDLSSGKISTVPTSDYVPKWIGGRALAAKLYWDEVPPDCGALDPENRLIFATCLTSGTLAAGQRVAVVAKSPVPMPECYMYGIPGGNWGAELKFAGFDAVVVRGKAPEPVCIWIHDGEVEILPATRWWGMGCLELRTQINRQFGDQTRAMVIGPAGENLVGAAVIANDGGSAAGTGGFGAVMGSKNLKAIAVRGTGSVKVARPKELIDVYDKYVKIGGLYSGPATAISLASQLFKQFTYRGMEECFGEHALSCTLIYEMVQQGLCKYKHVGCFSCPIQCGWIVSKYRGDVDLPFVIGDYCSGGQSWSTTEQAVTNRIKHDTAMGMGKLCIESCALAQDLGVNSAIFGGSGGLGWSLETFQKGVLTAENTGLPVSSLDLEGTSKTSTFGGTSEFIKALFHNVTYPKTDLWRRIGQGIERFLAGAAEESEAGKELYEKLVSRPDYFMSREGNAGPSDAAAMIGGAILLRKQYADSWSIATGDRQFRGKVSKEEAKEFIAATRAKWAPFFGSEKWFDLDGEEKTFEGKMAAQIFFNALNIEGDSVGCCRGAGNFPRWYSSWTEDQLSDPAVSAKLFSAITGIDHTLENTVEFMAPTLNLERAIRVREGQRREHDSYNDAAFEKVSSWTSKDEFNSVMDDYYKAVGWDVDTGIPTRSRLEELGLKDVADDLEKKYGIKVPA